MSTRQPPSIGVCPSCEVHISRAGVLIEYETADGTLAVWAECPRCADVVHPV